MTLYLVRHGRPLVDPSKPAHAWSLDPAYDDDVRALRSRLPDAAAWCSSPEPKAFMTARLLTEAPIEVVPDLREHERHTSDWVEDFHTVVARAFAEPDVVLVGHGTAWTCLVSALRGQPPDLDAWARLGLPDVCQCQVPLRLDDMLAP